MSELVKPDKVYETPDYAKYLLMNTNTSFCQSDMKDAEKLMTEVKTIDQPILKAIPGFISKMEDLDKKMQAYHSMDDIWNRFLETKKVTFEELEAIEAAKTSCEKKTLAKYSYMTAHMYFCEGEVEEAKKIFETRTLRLTEKTSLRVRDVKGLRSEVADMKALFQDMDKLDVAWNKYLKTGVSPGFETELPLFICYPIPNMKEYLLRGAADVCTLGPEMLEKIKDLETESGVKPDRTLAKKVKELELAIASKDKDLADLDAAWKAFIPDNTVKRSSNYGYDYCNKEALIRAYIMDGFSFVCELAEEMLEKIDSMQRYETMPLEEITMVKINELAEINERYQLNGQEVEELWTKFVSQGDTLYETVYTTEDYCDNIHQVKDWTMYGHCGGCEEMYQYLDKIETFQETFEFNFTKDLECRVQNLRVKLWDCRYKVLLEIARLESSEGSYETRLQELIDENGIGERPEVCST